VSICFNGFFFHLVIPPAPTDRPICRLRGHCPSAASHSTTPPPQQHTHTHIYIYRYVPIYLGICTILVVRCTVHSIRYLYFHSDNIFRAVPIYPCRIRLFRRIFVFRVCGHTHNIIYIYIYIPIRVYNAYTVAYDTASCVCVCECIYIYVLYPYNGHNNACDVCVRVRVSCDTFLKKKYIYIILSCGRRYVILL